MREGQGIEDGWVVSAKIKDQQGLMKDRVRERERKRDGIQSILLDLGRKRLMKK